MVTIDVDATDRPAQPSAAIRLAGRDVPVIGPSRRDPRLHLAATTISILVVGMALLDFRLSIPQVVLPVVACAAFDVVRNYRRFGAVVWPASAMQTATSIALILRVTGFEAGRWWSFEGWYYFVGIAIAGLLGKNYIRHRGRHVFNPSNVALVVAFVALGAERIEPLDFWWGPFDGAMALAYVVILVGGVTLCRRLRLVELAVSSYLTLMLGVGVLAVLGQSITTQWSLSPVSGTHFWWIVITSPETLIFVLLMITDPRTVPTGRSARIVFGCATGVMSTLLLAPWETEFGTKVGLLGGLVAVTALRPFVERWHEGREARGLRSRDPGAARVATRVALGGLGIAGFVAVAAAAGVPNRSAAAPGPTDAPIAAGDRSAPLPQVTIDDDVAALSAELATLDGARELAEALAFNLAVEAEAARTRDPSLLTAVAHGQRLDDMMITIEGAADSDVDVPEYRFDSLHLSIVYPGGAQRGANAGLSATGTAVVTTYSTDGHAVASREEPVDVMFSLRQFDSGRWLTTDTITSDD